MMSSNLSSHGSPPVTASGNIPGMETDRAVHVTQEESKIGDLDSMPSQHPAK
jgi:hypothetical protein